MEAIVGAYRFDARRCISYLTIELRGSIPENLRARMGDWLFGCDACQGVCPWNRKAPVADEPAWSARPDVTSLQPRDVLAMSDVQFRQRFRGTALFRAAKLPGA